MNSNWQNPALADAARDFVVESVNLLGGIRPDALPVTLIEKISSPEEGQVQANSSFEIDYHLTVNQHWDELESLPGYSRFLREIRADPTAKQQLNTQIWVEYESGRGYSERDFATQILVDILRSHGITRFENEVFAESYARFEEFIFGDSVRFMTVMPLNNFESKVVPVDLGSGISIVRVSDEQINQINEIPHNSLLFRFSSGLPRYGIRIDYKREKIMGNWRPKNLQPDPVRGLLDKIISALRLLKGGVFGPAMIGSFNLTWGRLANSQILGGRTAMHIANAYVLEEQDIPKLQSFWNEFKQIDFTTGSVLTLSLRRFNFSQGRGLIEDKLVDLMIGFEALFLRRDDHQELSYRLAIRTAFLLGSNKESKKEIFDTMRAGYHLRSNVVHGEPLKKAKIGADELTLQELLDRLEGYLRASITKLLERSRVKSNGDFISELDDKILS